ncbi:hypothetical protein U5907_03865 [Bacteroidales bacterium MB20-C3-3]|jgi:hypothetical protein|nr:hypothetical protein U5907_03865 [Bacteroidales bacterium MB20-C3-3]
MKKLLLLTLVLSSLFFLSCQKESIKLSGTEWKSFDVDTRYEEYILIKFKTTTFEMWYKDIGDPIFMGYQGIYTTTDNTLTLMKDGNELVGVINKNILTFSEDGEIYTFTKQ